MGHHPLISQSGESSQEVMARQGFKPARRALHLWTMNLIQMHGDGSLPLLIFELASSIPLIIAGAALIMALISMLPILIWAGSALLGWIAGDVIATDPAVHPRLQSLFEGATGVELDALLTLIGVAPLFVGGNGSEIACAVLGAILVLIAGSIWRRQRLHPVAPETR